MTATRVIWHGTEVESAALVKAIGANCMCQFHKDNNAHLSTCEPHRAMLEDQRWLDGLLFMRRKRACLFREEMRT